MGLDKAVEEVKHRMSRYSVTPNMMYACLPPQTHPVPVCATNTNLTLPVCLSVLRIIPPQLSLYMALAPEAKLTYPLAGPAGPAAFSGGVQGFEAQQFRGLGVFTSTPVSHLQEHSHTHTHNHVPLLKYNAQSSHGAGPLVPIRSTRFRTTRTACRCCSARPRSASSTACRRRPSGT